jgi:hypothetical protein
MSNSALRVLAGAGAKDDPVYVDDVFSTDVWDGNGSARNITNGVDLSGEGGFVWIKTREQINNHVWYDTVRGAGKQIISNGNGAESTRTDTLTAFNNNGYALGADATYGTVNFNGNGGYVGWTFRKQAGFFDVLTYTGDGSSNRAISHNLDSKPGLIIIKATGMSAGWMVGAGFTSTQYYRLALDTSGAASGGGLANYNNYFSAEPTTTTFSVGNEGLGNSSGQTYVAYLFANDDQRFGEDSDEAAIKVGTYTGNGSSTGPTIDLGFEPQFILIKSIGSSDSWGIFDTMRGIRTGGNDAYLQAHTGDQEFDNADWLDLTATGFNITNSADFVNKSSTQYIYMAIRRPHKPASEFAATDLFTPVMGLNASAGGKVFATTYPVDFHFAKNNINGTGDWYVRDRLRGGNNYLNTNDPRAQSSHAYNNEFDHMDGIYTTTALDNTSVIGYEFRRAPGFMDVVTYAGLGSPQNINHNLGVAPELIIVKGIDYSVRWAVWYNGIGTDASGYNKYLALNQTDGDITGGSVWLDMVSTASVFRPNDAFVNEAPRNYVGYLFASASGISKVGTYSGTGSDLNVDCGFSSGARFVLIKRTDSTGDWYVYDSVRGIVAGNDPYLFVNSNAAGVTTTDYIDPLSSGFTITSSAPAALNASGGTYLFLAIA